MRRLSCARSRACRPLCATRTHTAVCRERLGPLDFRPDPHASRSGRSADNPTIAISVASRARSVRARSARKMIQWIIFSESGPEGPGCNARRLLADARSARCEASLQQARLTSPFLLPESEKTSNIVKPTNIKTALSASLSGSEREGLRRILFSSIFCFFSPQGHSNCAAYS